MIEAVKEVEDMLDDKIYQTFGVPLPSEEIKAMVKIVDKASYIIESMTTGPVGAENMEMLQEEHPDSEIWRIVHKAMPNLIYVSNCLKRGDVDSSDFAYGCDSFEQIFGIKK
jgi:hypothetical protein